MLPAAAQSLRTEVQAIADEANAELAAAWASVTTLTEGRDLLVAETGDILALFQEAAAALAADWYDDLRDASGVAGNFTAIFPELRAPGVDELARWAEESAREVATMLTLAQGGIQRRIANAARETVADSTIADPQALGWQRVGSGDCYFCRALIARGAVYGTKFSASFAAHDNCKCAAMPAWGGRPVPVRAYKPSRRQSTEADRARVREWIKNHPANQ